MADAGIDHFFVQLNGCRSFFLGDTWYRDPRSRITEDRLKKDFDYHPKKAEVIKADRCARQIVPLDALFPSASRSIIDTQIKDHIQELELKIKLRQPIKGGLYPVFQPQIAFLDVNLENFDWLVEQSVSEAWHYAGGKGEAWIVEGLLFCQLLYSVRHNSTAIMWWERESHVMERDELWSWFELLKHKLAQMLVPEMDTQERSEAWIVFFKEFFSRFAEVCRRIDRSKVRNELRYYGLNKERHTWPISE